MFSPLLRALQGESGFPLNLFVPCVFVIYILTLLYKKVNTPFLKEKKGVFLQFRIDGQADPVPTELRFQFCIFKAPSDEGAVNEVD